MVEDFPCLPGEVTGGIAKWIVRSGLPREASSEEDPSGGDQSQALVVRVQQGRPVLGSVPKGPWMPAGGFGHLSDGVAGEGARTGVTDNPVERRVGIHRRQFLESGRILGVVRSRVAEEGPGLHHGAVEFEPGIEGAFAGHMVEGPLQGLALHMENVAVILVGDQSARIFEVVTRLDGVPAKV